MQYLRHATVQLHAYIHMYSTLYMQVQIAHSLYHALTHREGRLRHHLGPRYDSRSGVFDWDYHMKLQEMVSTLSTCNISNFKTVLIKTIMLSLDCCSHPSSSVGIGCLSPTSDPELSFVQLFCGIYPNWSPFVVRLR